MPAVYNRGDSLSATFEVPREAGSVVVTSNLAEFTQRRSMMMREGGVVGVVGSLAVPLPGGTFQSHYTMTMYGSALVAPGVASK
jgi:hypothetical protein